MKNGEVNKYQALFDHSLSALFIGKTNGLILEANEAACNMFGYTLEEFRRLKRGDIIAPESPDLEEKLKQREQNRGVSGELIAIRKNGERFWCEFTSSIFEGSDGEHYTSVMMLDISEKKETEANLKKRTDELARVFSSAPDLICIAGFDGYFKKINTAAAELLGYTEEELLSQPFANLLHPEDLRKAALELSGLQHGNSITNLQNRVITKSGRIIWLSWSAKIFYDEDVVYAVARDITAQKELELLHDHATRLNRIGSWELDLNVGDIYWSAITKEIYEADPDYDPSMDETIHLYKEGEDREKLKQAIKEAIEMGKPWELELQIVTLKGNERWVQTIGEAEFVDGVCVRLYGSIQDIDERMETQNKILYKTGLIEAIATINSTFLATDDWKKALYHSFTIIGKSVNADRVYYFENHTHPETGEILSNQKLEWAKDEQIIQMDNPDLQDVEMAAYPEFLNPLRNQQPYIAKVRHIRGKKLRKLLESQDILSILVIPLFVKQQFHGFIGFDDCTLERDWTEDETSFLMSLATNLSYAIESYQSEIELRNLYSELESKVKALASSNAELEQFAFIASHDLQEPLRMITSFLALIERNYADKMDKKGLAYIHYATDGAIRMKKIILDLLDYSRVGKADVERTVVDLNEILTVVLSLNRKMIEEKEARITWEELPVVEGVYSQFQQLFQNLIHNALNYQKPDQKPVIHVSFEERSDEWSFSVIDNGIGIHAEYKDKIFNIFQRLHTEEEYSGTGVGLAICKKIVEENGGSIGVNSEEGVGSTFYFTLPKKGMVTDKNGA